MKIIIIDEKGRLFGKINVIDCCLVVFLILCLTRMFYFGYKLYLGNKRTQVELKLQREEAAKQSIAAIQKVVTQKKEIIELPLRFVLNKLEPEVLGLISVGDKEIDGEGWVIGEIFSLKKAEPVVYKIDIGNGKKMLKQDPVLKKMFASLKIKAEFREGTLYYKNKQILLNSPIDFKTDKYQVEAIYVSPEGEPNLCSASQIDDLINRITALEEEVNIILSSPKIKK